MTLTAAAHHTAPHVSGAALLLIAVAALALYIAHTLGNPHGKCRACHGRGLTLTRVGRRPRRCRPCGGTGTRRKPLATFIHRTYWIIRAERDRAAQARTTTPEEHP